MMMEGHQINESKFFLGLDKSEIKNMKSRFYLFSSQKKVVQLKKIKKTAPI